MQHNPETLTPDEQLAARCQHGPLHIFEHEIHALLKMGVSREAVEQYCVTDRAGGLNRKQRRRLKAMRRDGLLR